MYKKYVKTAMLLLAALFCLTACNKDGDETIALEFGDGSSDKDVDTRLDNVVPSDNVILGVTLALTVTVVVRVTSLDIDFMVREMVS